MRCAVPAVSALFAFLLLFTASPVPAALPQGKPRHFPAESLSVNYLSKEILIVAQPDSTGPFVDSTLRMTYREFRLDTLAFEYRAPGDTILRTLRVAKSRITGFYYQPPVLGHSAIVMGIGVLVVMALFLL